MGGNIEWQWFQHTGMINAQNLINDGLDIPPAEASGRICTNNHRTVWTYNQGVILGGLAELSRANDDPSLNREARKLAMAGVTHLVDEKGVLHDPCEPKCGADGVQFKGILVRNLVLLDLRRRRRVYESFVEVNADSIWNRAQVQLAETWTGPFST